MSEFRTDSYVSDPKHFVSGLTIILQLSDRIQVGMSKEYLQAHYTSLSAQRDMGSYRSLKERGPHVQTDEICESGGFD